MSKNTTSILVSGATGTIGRLVAEAIRHDERFVLAGEAGRDCFFYPAAAADVIIDFSHADLLDKTLEHALAHEIPLVTGTTALDDGLLQRIYQAAEKIPVCVAANFSLGVNVLAHLAEQAAQALGPEFDIEIVESHHRRKLDAPSGTALWLGEAVARARSQNLRQAAVYDRHRRHEPRPAGEIGFSTLRGGDVVGDHTVHFLADGERLELTHRAGNRRLYALGALRAALEIRHRGPGLVEFAELLFGSSDQTKK
ncbi:MAG TPA: 4-hydroxy-tetrahydrodipicolinate reductase [Wenzhouxiangella sp.]|nr:4-hydroxy-tetrahydrodipicolinate reductase [Wenzhouxiangella sp.]